MDARYKAAWDELLGALDDTSVLVRDFAASLEEMIEDLQMRLDGARDDLKKQVKDESEM